MPYLYKAQSYCNHLTSYYPPKLDFNVYFKLTQNSVQEKENRHELLNHVYERSFIINALV